MKKPAPSCTCQGGPYAAANLLYHEETCALQPPPPAPSERMIQNCPEGHACINGLPFECPWCRAFKAEAERREEINRSVKLAGKLTDAEDAVLKLKVDLATARKESDERLIVDNIGCQMNQGDWNAKVADLFETQLDRDEAVQKGENAHALYREADAKVIALKALLRDAPHGRNCTMHHVTSTLPGARQDERPCDCRKREIEEALRG